MTPKTIAEATAKCDNQYCADGTLMLGPRAVGIPCDDCNGTGYACGVAPTEVERHLFAIVEATRALVEQHDIEAIQVKALALEIADAFHPHADWVEDSWFTRAARLEALALSTRKETTCTLKK